MSDAITRPADSTKLFLFLSTPCAYKVGVQPELPPPLPRPVDDVLLAPLCVLLFHVRDDPRTSVFVGFVRVLPISCALGARGCFPLCMIACPSFSSACIDEMTPSHVFISWLRDGNGGTGGTGE